MPKQWHTHTHALEEGRWCRYFIFITATEMCFDCGDGKKTLYFLGIKSDYGDYDRRRVMWGLPFPQIWNKDVFPKAETLQFPTRSRFPLPSVWACALTCLLLPTQVALQEVTSSSVYGWSHCAKWKRNGPEKNKGTGPLLQFSLALLTLNLSFSCNSVLTCISPVAYGRTFLQWC